MFIEHFLHASLSQSFHWEDEWVNIWALWQCVNRSVFIRHYVLDHFPSRDSMISLAKIFL